MYELMQVGDSSYYIQSPAKVGLWKASETEVCLIDSGSDKDAARKIKRLLDERGWTLRAIYVTHSHADHIGGCAYLQAQTGCTVYAAGMELDATRHPLWEPTLLYGGYPCGELRHKFLLAQPCEVQPLTAQVLPQGWDMIPLPGHYLDMVGFRTPDGVVYLADCLSSEVTLEKYGVPFLVDVQAYMQTLDTVKTMKAAMFVPSHAAPMAEIAPLAQYNMDHIRRVIETIKSFCETPCGFDDLLARVFSHYGLTMTWEQHALVGSTVRSILAQLKDAGEMTTVFEQNRMLWSCKEA